MHNQQGAQPTREGMGGERLVLKAIAFLGLCKHKPSGDRPFWGSPFGADRSMGLGLALVSCCGSCLTFCAAPRRGSKELRMGLSTKLPPVFCILPLRSSFSRLSGGARQLCSGASRQKRGALSIRWTPQNTVWRECPVHRALVEHMAKI